MKRSDMVMYITGHLMDQEKMLDLEFNFSKIEIADFVLELVEKEGMLPPPYTVKRTVNAMALGTIERDAIIYKWEKEDE